MSQEEDKRQRIRSRIESSQERLKRDSRQLPAIPPASAVSDSETGSLRGFASAHPVWTVAAGLGAGLLVGALLPRRFGSKFSKRAIGLATLGAELAVAASRNARDAASEGAREGLHRIEEGTAPLRRRANRAGQSARSTGLRLAGEAVKLATRLRK